MSTWPAREDVERIALEAAQEAGESLVAVLGVTYRLPARKARQRAWLRILDETGCTILGLSEVWGCDRRSIQRARATFSTGKTISWGKPVDDQSQTACHELA